MRLAAVCGVAAIVSLNASAGDFSFDRTESFLNTYCGTCHSGKTPAAGFNISRISTETSLADQADRWTRVANRVKNGEMPPRGYPAPPSTTERRFSTGFPIRCIAPRVPKGAPRSIPHTPAE